MKKTSLSMYGLAVEKNYNNLSQINSRNLLPVNERVPGFLNNRYHKTEEVRLLIKRIDGVEKKLDKIICLLNKIIPKKEMVSDPGTY